MPYGLTYIDKPTDRCSDGCIVMDYRFSYLLLLFLVPPPEIQERWCFTVLIGSFVHEINM
jgi:hypothetical protein